MRVFSMEFFLLIKYVCVCELPCCLLLLFSMTELVLTTSGAGTIDSPPIVLMWHLLESYYLCTKRHNMVHWSRRIVCTMSWFTLIFMILAADRESKCGMMLGIPSSDNADNPPSLWPTVYGHILGLPTS